MFYTIYKTTNLLNGKFYIGKHKTKDPFDKYLGSGVDFNLALKEFGRENFVKDVIHVFDEEWKMKLAEKILVVVDKEISYNLYPGGAGCWDKINKILTKEQRSQYGALGALASAKTINTEENKAIRKLAGKKIAAAHINRCKEIAHSLISEEEILKLDINKRGWTTRLRNKIGIVYPASWLARHFPHLFAISYNKNNRQTLIQQKQQEIKEQKDIIKKERSLQKELKRKKHLEQLKYPNRKCCRNTFWWNDGINNKRSEFCPGPNFVLGRLKFDLD